MPSINNVSFVCRKKIATVLYSAVSQSFRARLHQYQRQHSENSVMTLVILFSLKEMESLENGLQPQSGELTLFSMTPVLV